jgi:hypothetical protein
MSAADLVITTSGDTCAEARTVGRPLLVLDVLPGHGRDNLQHELELGDAIVTSPGTADVTRSALAALDRAKPAPACPVRSQADWETAFMAALGSCGLWSVTCYTERRVVSAKWRTGVRVRAGVARCLRIRPTWVTCLQAIAPGAAVALGAARHMAEAWQ